MNSVERTRCAAGVKRVAQHLVHQLCGVCCVRFDSQPAERGVDQLAQLRVPRRVCLQHRASRGQRFGIVLQIFDLGASDLAGERSPVFVHRHDVLVRRQ